MLLLDYSGISIAALAKNMLAERKKEIEMDYGKHLVLNSILDRIVRFKGKFGKTVICCDSPKSWRRDYFKYYKAARKKTRESDKSPINWDSLFAVSNALREEIPKYFPIDIFEAEGYEADDVIAACIMHVDEPMVICSEDKDFYQLLAKKDVYIFHNRSKEIYVSDEITVPDVFEFVSKFMRGLHTSPFYAKVIQVDKNFAYNYIVEHIIRGDSADGIPNILSDDDVFVNPDKRQKPITKKVLNQLMSVIDEDKIDTYNDQQVKTNYVRNMNLIALSKPAKELVGFISEKQNLEPKNIGALDTQKWLMNQGLLNLANRVNDFYQ